MLTHNRLKRIGYRVMEEIRSTGEIAKWTSWSDAAVTFLAKVDIQKMNRNGYQEPENVKKRLMKKHEVMLRLFERKFEPFLKECDFNPVQPAEEPIYRDRIWVCWWQGLDTAPEVIKKCVDSVIRNAGSHTVTVITEENYREFANIPAWVEEKFRRGIISRTHFSDILRLSLLARHGGMWLDATFFCTEPVLSDYFRLPLWTVKRPDYSHGSVACGQFATYSLACSYENRWIFGTIRDFVLHYWKTHDFMIDYLFLDYLFVLALRSDPRIMAAFEAIEPNNPQCDELCKVLNSPYDQQMWESMHKNTSLFKLTWKQTFESFVGGRKSFYTMLVEDELGSVFLVKQRLGGMT